MIRVYFIVLQIVFDCTTDQRGKLEEIILVSRGFPSLFGWKKKLRCGQYQQNVKADKIKIYTDTIRWDPSYLSSWNAEKLLITFHTIFQYLFEMMATINISYMRDLSEHRIYSNAILKSRSIMQHNGVDLLQYVLVFVIVKSFELHYLAK